MFPVGRVFPEIVTLPGTNNSPVAGVNVNPVLPVNVPLESK